jgi:site-specific DNA-methyltransferase (adenine-specific)
MTLANTVVCANCAEWLATLPAEFVDLTVTSPPYGAMRAYNGYVFEFEPIAAQLFRVTKPGGVLVWVVNDETENGESGESFRQALFFKQCGFWLWDTMLYMKHGPAYPEQTRYYQVFEYMFVLSKGKPKTFNPIKDRVNRWFGEKWSKVRSRRQKDGELVRTAWEDGESGKLGVRFNIWQYDVGGQGNHGDPLCQAHPASFPEALAEDHIRSWSNAGDLVLDPLCGSGTTLKMAKLLGRHWLGCDISAEYVALSQKRLANTVYTPVLIDGA